MATPLRNYDAPDRPGSEKASVAAAKAARDRERALIYHATGGAVWIAEDGRIIITKKGD